MRPRAAYAADPALSRGRQHLENLGETRGPRTAFQRDRDRNINIAGFRRLRHKTQVFIAPDGDHYRVRLTHSLEVAQIGRTIARALGLDEDLTEALCLAHDIGHPPFGHAGEDALTQALAPYGGFDHNAQTLRQVSALETPYPRWAGLNLSWETLEGLAKHNGPVANPGWALAEANAAFGLDLARWPSLEAQVAAVADDIAYDNHDIDDGLRAGLLDREEVLAQPFLAANWADVRRRFADVADTRLMPELVRHQIGWMVNDVIEATRARCRDLRSVEEVRDAGRMLGGFSDETAAAERDFKRFMYTRLYHHPQQMLVAESAHQIIAGLATAYLDDPELLPGDWRTRLPQEQPARARHIGDFIAGMTDRYALARFAELVGPPPVMDGV